MTDGPLVPAGEVRRWIEAIEPPVAVTGGTGFVGSHLVDTLAEAGLRPRVLVRDPANPRWIAGRDVEWVPGGLGDGEALERLVEGARTVLHLAGVVRAGSAAAFDEANRIGTERLVHAVTERATPGARFVLVSSLAAVGPSDRIEGVTPGDPPHPISAYGRSKLGGEEAVRRLGGDRPWVILRPPAIYGPRDVDILQFFKLAAGGVVPLPAGERWITIAHVADVVRAVLAAAGPDGPSRAVFHLGEPRPYRLQAMVRLLAEAGGVRARIVPVPGAVVRALGAGGSLLQRLGMRGVAMTSDKARELLARHWTARTADSLERLGVGEGIGFFEGAAATWTWYRAEGWVR